VTSRAPVPHVDPPEVDVLVVGAGPVGLTAANLLAAVGTRTLVVEQHPATSDQPKAVTIDGESLRILQRAGLEELVYPVIHPGTGTAYLGSGGRQLFHTRGPDRPPHGHPVKNPFDQPELEQALLTGLKRFSGAETRFSTLLVGLDQDATSVTGLVRGPEGVEERIRARFMLGCDGGRSTVRRLLGVRMRGATVPQRWIVVDTLRDPHQERHVTHVADPGRPHVIVPNKGGCCRYEFLCLPGDETEEGSVPLDLVRGLLAPYRPLVAADVARLAVYSYHALVAERWRVGRTLLLGDAAHMMPPFAGQGLNTGIRDADNLTWRLAAILRGTATDRVLDSYEIESQAHARAMVRLSTWLGRIETTRNRPLAWTRDALVRLAARHPAGNRYLREGQYKPEVWYRSGLVIDNGSSLVGRRFPQLELALGDGSRQRLDDLIGPSWALIAFDGVDTTGVGDDPFWPTLPTILLAVSTGDRPQVARPGWIAATNRDGLLERFWEASRRTAVGSYVLLRPDRVVAAVFESSDERPVARKLWSMLQADCEIGQ
jgi:3-(3-hydroxy-phenyl)propionate hydroxylase